MSLWKQATEAAFHAQQMARGVSATWRVSDALTITDLTIVPAETLRQDIGEDGVVMTSRTQDWLVLASDLDGNEPKRSHRITVGSDEYELVEFENEKPFRFHNAPANSIYRVHTVLTAGSDG